MLSRVFKCSFPKCRAEGVISFLEAIAAGRLQQVFAVARAPCRRRGMRTRRPEIRGRRAASRHAACQLSGGMPTVHRQAHPDAALREAARQRTLARHNVESRTLAPLESRCNVDSLCLAKHPP